MANQESLDARVRTNQPALWLVGRAERPTERCDVHAIKLTEDELERANIGINLAVLPEYIAIKGGAARQTLEAVVHGRQIEHEPRDIDIVINASAAEKYSEDQVLSGYKALQRALSPRDAEYDAHGAEVLDSIEDYMDCHDFTINQVLLVPDDQGQWRLFATTQAIIDMEQSIVRPTIYEHDLDRRHRLSNKLALKAVRLVGAMRASGYDAEICSVDVADDTYGDPTTDIFMQLLQLDKELSLGIESARRYVDELNRYGVSPWGGYEGDPVKLYEMLLEAHGGFVPSDEALAVLPERLAMKYRQRNRDEDLATASRETEELYGVSDDILRQVPEEYINDYL